MVGVAFAFAMLWLEVAGGPRAPEPDAAARKPPAPFVVALDPGHGGSNLGTEQDGVQEKQITAELSRRLTRALEHEPGVRVVSCRKGDHLVPIRARGRCAQEAGAQLFLSLHVNASPKGPSRGTQQGFEIYVLPPAMVEEGAAEAELTGDDQALAVWQGHRVRAAAEESAVAARRVRARLGEALGAESDRGIKQAGAQLDVLRGLPMAAVLVEVGFLDHPIDAARLTTVAGLDAIAQALARAVTDLRTRAQRAAKTR